MCLGIIIMNNSIIKKINRTWLSSDENDYFSSVWFVHRLALKMAFGTFSILTVRKLKRGEPRTTFSCD